MTLSTLHEAIAHVLSQNQPLTFGEIANAIRSQDLWRRPSDGQFPLVKQIKDRSLYKYSDFFERINGDQLRLNRAPHFQSKITRLTYNDRGWVEPSGWEGKSRVAGLHEADHGFGHEEWLFDFEKLIHGYKYGFIEGFRTKNNKHGGSAYNLQLFTIDGGEKIKYWVGKINNCYVLEKDEQLEIQQLFIRNGWIKQQEDQLKKLGLWDKDAKRSLTQFGPNVRFLEKDVEYFDPPIPVGKSTFINNRSRYLLYDWDSSAKITTANSPFVFKPSKPNLNKTVLRNNGAEFQSREIKQVHRQIATALHESLSKQFGIDKIDCDVAHNGTYIDMVRKSGNKYVLYEIKTYNQLRKNIREAIGQLLEYAYWNCAHEIKEIVIVSDKPIDTVAFNYLNFLKTQFNIPISYLQQVI